MSAPRILALFVGGRADERATTECLRLLGALVANGCPLRMATWGDGVGLFERGDLDAEAEKLLDGLAAFGAIPEEVVGGALEEAVRQADVILRLGPPGRLGSPPLLEIDPSSSTPIEHPLASAGQVVLRRRPPE